MTFHETTYSINEGLGGNRYYAQFETTHFSEGAIRYAFHGILMGNGPSNGKRCVVKVVKEQFALQLAVVKPDVIASQCSHVFARLFNDRILPSLACDPKRKMDFALPLYCQVEKVGNGPAYVKPGEYVTIEPWLEGNFEKYNSNGGYENPDSALPAFFTHWTFEASGHRFMVCDLQGMKTPRAYQLTDPAIHSYDLRFGDTDGGLYGMALVLRGHTCNFLCKQYGLPNIESRVFREIGPGYGMSTVLNLASVIKSNGIRMNDALKTLPHFALRQPLFDQLK